MSDHEWVWLGVVALSVSASFISAGLARVQPPLQTAGAVPFAWTVAPEPSSSNNAASGASQD